MRPYHCRSGWAGATTNLYGSLCKGLFQTSGPNPIKQVNRIWRTIDGVASGPPKLATAGLAVGIGGGVSG